MAFLVGPGYDERFTTRDSERGWRLRAGFGGWTAEENRLFVRINSDGLRDREHPRAKPPRTLRIAVLGDSYMQAMNVPWPDAFPARLESELRTCLAPVVPEVINFGVSGYVTAQELLTFQLLAADYHPDIVLTAFYAGNDLTDNYGPTADTATPFYALDGDTLSLDTSFRSRVFADQPWRIRVRMALTERSRLLMLLYRPWVAFRDWQRTQVPSSGEGNDGLDALRGATVSRIAAEWAVTEATLARLADKVRSAGAEPWLTSVTMAEQVDPDPAPRPARSSRRARLVLSRAPSCGLRRTAADAVCATGTGPCGDRRRTWHLSSWRHECARAGRPGALERGCAATGRAHRGRAHLS